VLSSSTAAAQHGPPTSRGGAVDEGLPAGADAHVPDGGTLLSAVGSRLRGDDL